MDATPDNVRPTRRESVDFDPYHKWLGIPPEEQPPNHYRLLGLQPFESDPEVIESLSEQRSAFLQNCQTGAHAEASQRLLDEVSAATLCLLNPTRKKRYDDQLRTQLAVAPAWRNTVAGSGGSPISNTGNSGVSFPAVEIVEHGPVATGPRHRPVTRRSAQRKLIGWAVVGAVALGLMLGGHWLTSRPKAAPVPGSPRQAGDSDPGHPAQPQPSSPAEQPTPMPFQPGRFTLDPLMHDGLKLAPVEPQRVAEGEPLTVAFPLTELPATGEPVYETEKLPPGAEFDRQAGVLTWTPDEHDGPGTYTVTVHVRVPGRPELTDEVSLTVHVVESNAARG